MHFQQLENNLSIYSFNTYTIINNKGINRSISWEDNYYNHFRTQTFSNNRFII